MRRAALGLLLAALAAPAARAHTVEQMMRMCASVEAPGPATDAAAFYFRRIEDAARFLEAFPMLEMADGTTSPAYTSPLFPRGRGAVGQ